MNGSNQDKRVTLCLKCLQKKLTSISYYDYPEKEYFEFPVTLIRHTPFRRYWRERCVVCKRKPLILIRVNEDYLRDPRKALIRLAEELEELPEILGLKNKESEVK